MTLEALKQAHYIQRSIEQIEAQIKLWEKSIAISTIKLNFENHDDYIEVDYIDYETLKVLTLHKLKSELELRQRGLELI